MLIPLVSLNSERLRRREHHPAGCLKSSDLSPAQPRRAKTRRSAGKAAANYHSIKGGWDDPTARCKRILSNSLHLSLREWPRLPLTARIERAPFHRARSASKKGTWPLPPMLADFFNILPVDYGWDIVRRQACRCDINENQSPSLAASRIPMIRSSHR